MEKKSTVPLIILAYIAFISLGMPDGLHGVAWPGIRETFGLPLDALGLLLIFATAGYMLSSFFSGPLVKKMGVGGLLSLSCAATATALMVYSITPFWWLFVIIATLGGLGAGAIDAGLNNYIDRNHSERLMQWLHASFGIGITLGPVIMTLGISLTGQWRLGYRVVSFAQYALALCFFLTRHLWKAASTDTEEEKPSESEASLTDSLKVFPVWLSMILFFLYTGVELGLGLWAYSLLTESRGVSVEIAGFITGSYWAMFTLGRILAGWYTKHLSLRRILNISLFSAMAGTLLIWLNLGVALSVAGIALTGFAVAPIFPALVSDTRNRVGLKHQSNTIGMQIAAAGFGAAVVPSIAGVLARQLGLEVIPIYLFMAILLLWLCLGLSHRAAVKTESDA